MSLAVAALNNSVGFAKAATNKLKKTLITSSLEGDVNALNNAGRADLNNQFNAIAGGPGGAGGPGMGGPGGGGMPPGMMPPGMP